MIKEILLSIAFLIIGVLGLLGVSFFSSNTTLEIIEIILGLLGLLLSLLAIFVWSKKSNDSALKSKKEAGSAAGTPAKTEEPVKTVKEFKPAVTEKPKTEATESKPQKAKSSDLKMIEGIGDVYEKKLIDVGVPTLERLLLTCASKKGRDALAKSSGISEKLILKWTNHADLIRINGIGGEYAELLEASGVDTVPELALRNAQNLAKKMAEINEAKKLVRKIPSETQVKDWIEQAKALPRIINY